MESCCFLFVYEQKRMLLPISQAIGGDLWYAGTITGKNICLTPSPFIIGKMIPDAP
jgi:hypothetical protein